jgi:2-polyprenyl-3-methyl-5-hydroxy-6-metoxy-1,4-benzoquinol methylase
MDDRLEEARVYYSSLAASSDDAAVRAGRPSAMGNKETAVWQDLLAKLKVEKAQQILDIGVGSGFIAEQWARLAMTLELSLTLVDFDSVISRVQAEIGSSMPDALSRIEFRSGAFPFSFDSDFLSRKSFDRIALYSVIHYTREPRLLIDVAAGMLQPGGRLLIGDIPNLDKKGRFLATERGRRFDAAYKQVAPESVPRYGAYPEFTKQALADGAPPLDDDFVLDVIESYRRKGFQAYVLEQPDDLPLNFTREDILLCAPDE